jgi:hypothetical protein
MTGTRPAPRASEVLGVPGLLLCASRDPDAKLTFVLSSPADAAPADRLAVKVPVTAAAARSVEAEGRALAQLRCLGLGRLGDTIPRYVRSPAVAGRSVLVSTALPGSPMTVRYHLWRHTARRPRVAEDLALAAGWLAEFQAVTASGSAPVTWSAETAVALRERWHDHPAATAVAERLACATDHLRGRSAPRTFVHGDFWCGNVLVRDGAVTGCVDWEAASPRGCPLRDLARFALSYALYLDRHTSPGRPVRGHRGLRRDRFGAGIAHMMLADSWVARDLRGFLGDGLERLGLPRSLWYDVALTGIAEVAVTANDDDFARGHLELLASLPCRPRRRTRR